MEKQWKYFLGTVDHRCRLDWTEERQEDNARFQLQWIENCENNGENVNQP